MESKGYYFLFSLGCKVNSYEVSCIGNELFSAGYEETDDVSKADIIILNTCSVTSVADKKSRQHIRSFRANNTSAILVVMGCYSQWNVNICIEAGADIVVGSTHRDKVKGYIDDFIANKNKIVDVSKNIRKEKYEELSSSSFCENIRAYLKIQDGCNHFCSYCLIPFVRGNSRSRKKEFILEEAKQLTNKGYKEIVITGVDIGAYGEDLYENNSYKLSNLLEDIILSCPRLERLRISSIDFSETDSYFLAILAKYPQIVSHMHMSLQSGSTTVLERMKRSYDVDMFFDKVSQIRSIRPDMAVTTDIIVGFPEETEEEFKETIEFCKKIKFAEIHVFPYSSRPGTAASRLKQVDAGTKKRRVNELLALSKTLRKDYETLFIDKELEILFESYDSEKKLAYGHSKNYLYVAIQSDIDLTNQTKNIVYTEKVAID